MTRLVDARGGGLPHDGITFNERESPVSATTNTATAEASTDPSAQAIEEYKYQRRAFRLHAATFAGSMVIIFIVNLLINLAAGITGEWWAWWSGWALIGWSLGIAVHGLVVRMSRPAGFESA